MLIPPSVLFIIYALIAEQSVGDMFIAGIGPGLLLTLAYCLQIWIMGRWFPRSVMVNVAHNPHAPALAIEAPPGAAEVWRKAGPIALLIALVLGGLYGGVFTPVEAGGAGAAIALVFALVRRKLTWRSFWNVLLETGNVSATLLFLITAASMYSRMLGMSGLPTQMEQIFTQAGIDFFGLLAIYVVIVIILGTLIDSSSIMLIMVPLFLVLLKSYQVDLVWFGVVTVVATEVGLLTPPFGLCVFVVHATLARADISLRDIFMGAAPFAFTMCLVVLLVVLFPEIATGLVYLRF
jgi:tripartite ATP-independent transporter DctM subunit